MRRPTLFLFPLATLIFACLQNNLDPKSDSLQPSVTDPDCRIGGTSVGCGNPTKSVAESDVEVKDCGEGWCKSGFPDVVFTLGVDQDLILRFPSIQNSSNPPEWDSTSSFMVKARFGKQMWLLDSTDLAAWTIPFTDSVAISFRQLCQAADQPGRLCSEKRWDEIPLTLELNLTLYAKGFSYPKAAYIHHLWINTRTEEISFKPDDVDTLARTMTYFVGKLSLTDTEIGNSDRPSLQMIFIPGTDKFSVTCDNRLIQPLDPLPLGNHPIRMMRLLANPSNSWQPVYAWNNGSFQPTPWDSLFVDSLAYGDIRERYCPEK